MTTSNAERFIGGYGPDFQPGVLSEHAADFVVAGGGFRVAASGRVWAVIPGGRAVPVVCSEIIQVETEDGPISGRCGTPATGDFGACPFHAAQIEGWRNQTEAETLAWEREREFGY